MSFLGAANPCIFSSVFEIFIFEFPPYRPVISFSNDLNISLTSYEKQKLTIELSLQFFHNCLCTCHLFRLFSFLCWVKNFAFILDYYDTKLIILSIAKFLSNVFKAKDNRSRYILCKLSKKWLVVLAPASKKGSIPFKTEE